MQAVGDVRNANQFTTLITHTYVVIPVGCALSEVHIGPDLRSSTGSKHGTIRRAICKTCMNSQIFIG